MLLFLEDARDLLLFFTAVVFALAFFGRTTAAGYGDGSRTDVYRNLSNKVFELVSEHHEFGV